MGRRGLILYFGCLGVVAVLGVLFVLWPSPLLGVDRESLGQSVVDDFGDGTFAECSPMAVALSVAGEDADANLPDDSDWSCVIKRGDSSSSTVAKRVHVRVNWLGCWEGVDGYDGTGCIRVFDHLG